MGPQEHPRGQQQRVVLVELGELGIAPVVGPHVRAVQQRDGQVVVPDLWGVGGSGMGRAASPGRPAHAGAQEPPPGAPAPGVSPAQAGTRAQRWSSGLPAGPSSPVAALASPVQPLGLAGPDLPSHRMGLPGHSHPRPASPPQPQPRPRAALTFTVQSLEQDASW